MRAMACANVSTDHPTVHRSLLLVVFCDRYLPCGRAREYNHRIAQSLSVCVFVLDWFVRQFSFSPAPPRPTLHISPVAAILLGRDNSPDAYRTVIQTLQIKREPSLGQPPNRALRGPSRAGKARLGEAVGSSSVYRLCTLAHSGRVERDRSPFSKKWGAITAQRTSKAALSARLLEK